MLRHAGSLRGAISVRAGLPSLQQVAKMCLCRSWKALRSESCLSLRCGCMVWRADFVAGIQKQQQWTTERKYNGHKR